MPGAQQAILLFDEETEPLLGSRALKRAHRLFTLYLLFSLGVVPAIIYLRSSGVFNSAELTQYVNTATVVALLLTGPAALRRPRSRFQILLVAVGVQAAMLGLLDFGPEVARDFGSHLFQLCSAYVVFNLGAMMGPRLTSRYWRRLAVVSMVASIVGLLFTGRGIEAGTVTRFTAPAPLFSLAYGIVHAAPGLTGGAVLLTFLSGKRGPIVAVAAVLVAGLLGKQRARLRVPRGLFKVSIACCVVGFAWIVITVGSGALPEHPNLIQTVARQSYARIDRAYEALNSRDEGVLDAASSGRVAEVRLVLDKLDPVSVITGRGAGASIQISESRSRQYTHFSPLSLCFVYGAPFALALYLFIGRELIRASRYRARTSPPSLVPYYYLIGAVVGSLFAYSLFVDLLLFFSVGVLYQANRASRP